jgi:hypothetical protein
MIHTDGHLYFTDPTYGLLNKEGLAIIHTIIDTIIDTIIHYILTNYTNNAYIYDTYTYYSIQTVSGGRAEPQRSLYGAKGVFAVGD